MSKQFTKILMDSAISSLKTVDNFPLSAKSILISKRGARYIVGDTARLISPEAQRAQGNHIDSSQYETMVLALLAKLVGEGQHKIRLALSAPANNYKAVVGDGKLVMKSEYEDNIKELTSSFGFVDSESSAEEKNCQVEIEGRITVVPELVAVASCLPPKDFRSYALFQIGHGDLQSMIVKEGSIVPGTLVSTPGLGKAIDLLAQRLNVSEQKAFKAWFAGHIETGLSDATITVVDEIKAALDEFLSDSASKHFNMLRDHQKDIKHVVSSGGSILEPNLFSMLSREIKSRGFTLYPIHKLKKVDADLGRDPTFTCCLGLSNFNNSNVFGDLGNGRIKGACYESVLNQSKGAESNLLKEEGKAVVSDDELLLEVE